MKKLILISALLLTITGCMASKIQTQASHRVEEFNDKYWATRFKAIRNLYVVSVFRVSAQIFWKWKCI